jgi:hypothetical protein
MRRTNSTIFPDRGFSSSLQLLPACDQQWHRQSFRANYVRPLSFRQSSQQFHHRWHPLCHGHLPEPHWGQLVRSFDAAEHSDPPDTGSGCKRLAAGTGPELVHFQAIAADLAGLEDSLAGRIGLESVGRRARPDHAGSRLVEVGHRRTGHMKVGEVPGRILLVDKVNVLGLVIGRIDLVAAHQVGRMWALGVDSRILLAKGLVSRRLRLDCTDRMGRSYLMEWLKVADEKVM